MSSLETADVYSKAGLIAGSVAIVSLVTSDAVLGGAKFSLSQPLHGLAIMVLAILMDTCVTVQVGVWLGRRQERFAREIADDLKKVVVDRFENGYKVWLAQRPQLVKDAATEVLAELTRRSVPVAVPEPVVPEPEEPVGLSPESLAVGRRISARLNGAHS